MAFLETFGNFVFYDLPFAQTQAGRRQKQVFEKMWGHLRLGCMHFLRHNHGQHSEEHISAAEKELHEYAICAEKVCIALRHCELN